MNNETYGNRYLVKVDHTYSITKCEDGFVVQLAGDNAAGERRNVDVLASNIDELRTLVEIVTEIPSDNMPLSSSFGPLEDDEEEPLLILSSGDGYVPEHWSGGLLRR